jgi:hypothetical protein
MAVFRPKFKDQKTGKLKPSAVSWYKFYFAGQCIRESSKTTSKTLAKQAEQNGIANSKRDSTALLIAAKTASGV